MSYYHNAMGLKKLAVIIGYQVSTVQSFVMLSDPIWPVPAHGRDLETPTFYSRSPSVVSVYLHAALSLSVAWLEFQFLSRLSPVPPVLLPYAASRRNCRLQNSCNLEFRIVPHFLPLVLSCAASSPAPGKYYRHFIGGRDYPWMSPIDHNSLWH